MDYGSTVEGTLNGNEGGEGRKEPETRNEVWMKKRAQELITLLVVYEALVANRY